MAKNNSIYREKMITHRKYQALLFLSIGIASHQLCSAMNRLPENFFNDQMAKEDKKEMDCVRHGLKDKVFSQSNKTWQSVGKIGPIAVIRETGVSGRIKHEQGLLGKVALQSNYPQPKL
jgi:hypothetical protein